MEWKREMFAKMVGAIVLIAVMWTGGGQARADDIAVLSPDEVQVIQVTTPLPILLGTSDVDKLNLAAKINWYDDVNSNGSHNPGEPFALNAQAGWSNPTSGYDLSCWLASGANMLEQLGVVADADALYMNYALNGVPSPGGTLTWDEGGLQEYVIQHWMNQNPGNSVTMNVHWRSTTWQWSDTMFLWENFDPRAEMDNYLDTGWEVGIGMWPLHNDGSGGWHEGGHALTIQDIAAGMTFDCTDSDRDGDWSGPGDLNTYDDATRSGAGPNAGDIFYGYYNDFYDGNIAIYPVGDVGYICAITPEPTTLVLLAVGGMALIKRRKR
ncbi:MAG: PEP-CTERM sorting domain-containing protein [Phycisphaerae bacterium]|nr:PEP-CTERM sorting domain-containing protein [Phycisphaerae bacterium]